jgi:hypothetical protein
MEVNLHLNFLHRSQRAMKAALVFQSMIISFNLLVALSMMYTSLVRFLLLLSKNLSYRRQMLRRKFGWSDRFQMKAILPLHRVS